jgi:hypothetical protein
LQFFVAGGLYIFTAILHFVTDWTVADGPYIDCNATFCTLIIADGPYIDCNVTFCNLIVAGDLT